MDRAVSYLPIPRNTSTLKAGPFTALADPEMGVRLVRATDPARVARVRADAERHPSRLFANALVNVVWRNGPSRTSTQDAPGATRSSNGE